MRTVLAASWLTYALMPRAIVKRLVSLADKAKAARAAARRAVATREPPPMGLGFLESRSVRTATRDRYLETAARFYQWARKERLDWNSVEELDVLLCAYLDEMYFMGENSATGRYIIAAIMFVLPYSRKALPRSQTSMRGWTALNPPINGRRSRFLQCWQSSVI